MFKGRFICGVLIAAVVAVASSSPASANMLLNPGFEDGYSTNWTRSAGLLDGTGAGEDPHSGSKSWHGQWYYHGGPQTTTYYQDVPLTEGWTTDSSMWCKANAWGGVFGNDTHSFRLRVTFRNAGGSSLGSYAVNSPQPDDTWQQLVLSDMEAPVGTTHARVQFSYITTQMGNAYKVWNIDDLSFTAVPEPASLLILALGGCLLPARRRRV